MSTIYSDVSGDHRFWKPIDDPKGTEKDRARKIVSIPIALKQVENQQIISVAKGVSIAINRILPGDFLIQDIKVAKSYNNLVARVINIAM